MEKIDNKIPLIYISGWKGNGRESSSYKWLARHFKNTECYAAGGQTDVEKMVSDLQGIIDMCQSKYGRSPILVGNSYGGFLASLFPQTQVLLNPALFPAESLQQIADLSEEEIERFRQWQDRRLRFNRHRLRKNIFSVCTEGDELIPDHHTETISLNPAVMIPGGAHRLTDAQKDKYVLPLLMNLVKPDFRIVRISLEEPQRLLAGNAFKAMTRRFPTSFDYFEAAVNHLKSHLRRKRSQKSTIGYLIVEISKFEKQHALHQCSFDSEGRPLAEACMDCMVAFKGRDAANLPFRKGDYVIAYWCGGLTLGVIEAEPYTPQKVDSLIKTRNSKENFLDSSDDCYLVDFIDEGHGHPSVASVFPLPFDVSEIPEYVKKSLHWASGQ